MAERKVSTVSWPLPYRTILSSEGLATCLFVYQWSIDPFALVSCTFSCHWLFPWMERQTSGGVAAATRPFVLYGQQGHVFHVGKATAAC
jgi:hypothetical protein